MDELQWSGWVSLTSVIGVCVIPVRIAAEARQPVIGDFQHEATVYYAIGGLEVAMGHDHAVVKECHTLCVWGVRWR